METSSPLFDKGHRARLADKLSALLSVASTMAQLTEASNREALLAAIPRLYRRAGMIVGAYGFGLEAQRIDLLLASRRAALLQTRDGKSIDAVGDLIALLEDLLFLVADDIRKLPPLIAPAAPVPPTVKTLFPATKPPAVSKPVPTLKLPAKKKPKR